MNVMHKLDRLPAFFEERINYFIFSHGLLSKSLVSMMNSLLDMHLLVKYG